MMGIWCTKNDNSNTVTTSLTLHINWLVYLDFNQFDWNSFLIVPCFGTSTQFINNLVSNPTLSNFISYITYAVEYKLVPSVGPCSMCVMLKSCSTAVASTCANTHSMHVCPVSRRPSQNTIAWYASDALQKASRTVIWSAAKLHALDSIHVCMHNCIHVWMQDWVAWCLSCHFKQR